MVPVNNARNQQSIPDVNNPNFLRTIKSILDTREGNTKDGGQSFVTKAELASYGIIDGGYDDSGKWNPTLPSDKSGDTIPPNAPTNLKIENYVINHILSWTNPTDEDLSHIEVWQGNTQDRTQAKLFTIATKPVETVNIGGVSPRENYYYWIRAIDEAGNYSPWCPSDQMGGELVAGKFAKSINSLLSELTDDKKYESIHTIVADSFRIIEPSVGLTEGRKVFTTGNIAGNPTVGINGDLIVDGTVLARMIAAESITADKISTGDIFTMNIKSNNYSPNSVGFKIDASTGQAEFNSIKFKFQDNAPIPSAIDNGVVRTELLTKEQQLRNEINYAEASLESKLDNAVNDWNTTTISGGRIQTGTLTSNAVGTNLLVAHSANIANGIINNAHISNLSANKITTGSLNASLITTGVLNASLIKAGTLSADVIQQNGIPITKISSGVILDVKTFISKDRFVLNVELPFTPGVYIVLCRVTYSAANIVDGLIVAGAGYLRPGFSVGDDLGLQKPTGSIGETFVTFGVVPAGSKINVGLRDLKPPFNVQPTPLYPTCELVYILIKQSGE